MISKDDIINAAEVALEESGNAELFLVEVKSMPGEEFEIYIDSDSCVMVEDCITLSRAIESRFDRDTEDFALTVSSAGVGQPLKVARQYKKLVGKSAEVLLMDGTKILGTLDGFAETAEGSPDDANITLSYPEKQKVEGKKRPEIVTVTKTFPLSEVKTTKEHIDFK
jgi:ribosome maturation factor RimP